MKNLIALTVVGMLMMTNATADQLEYDLEVNGMVCAYCAYNVSRQLKSVAGVVPESVDVDLDQGRVTLRSENKLDKSLLADLLLQAGFELVAVQEKKSTVATARRQSSGSVVMTLTLGADRLVDGQFDALLEALGSIAAQRSGRIAIIAPGDLEEAILKPVLAGRRTVIDIKYDRVNRPGGIVRLDLIVD